MTDATPRLPETLALTLPDGVRLEADVYRPDGNGPWPVLLMRQPYGRRIANTLCYAHPSWYAAQGYLVVIQDVRGRGSSTGRFRSFLDEAVDGAASIAWAAALPGSSGRVGMYGFSYQGTAQLLATGMAGPELQAIAPAMIGWDLRRDWAYENDAFLLQGNLGWATQIAAETARHAGDRAAHAALFAVTRALPLHEPVQARPTFIDRHRDLTHYHAWLDTPADSPYWAAVSPSSQAARLSRSGPPMLFIGGWYDSHLPGTLAAHRCIAEAGQVATRLVIGPWGHFPWDRRVGAMDFGPEAVSDIDRLQIRWFDRWLKDVPNGVDHEPGLRLFDLGAKTWRDQTDWVPAATAFYPTATGRAAVAKNDGRLLRQPGPSGTEWLVHDPWRPAPSLGGAFGAQPGPADRSAVDARSDVLTFDLPIDAPMTLAGPVEAVLWLCSDAVSFDVACILSRVTATGHAIPIASGYCHLRSHDPAAPVTVPMRACCISLAPGLSLRLSLSAAAFPAFPVNPGTGEDPTRCGIADARVIQLGLLHGGDRASHIKLPIAN